jgi:hypothetical protein
MLRRRIGRTQGIPTRDTRHRGHSHNPSFATLDLREQGLGHRDDAEEIHLHAKAEVVHVEPIDQARLGHTSIIDKGIQPLGVLGLDLIRHGLNLLRLGHVEQDGMQRPLLLDPFFLQGIRPRGRQTRSIDLKPLLRQPQRQALPKASITPGNKHHSLLRPFHKGDGEKEARENVIDKNHQRQDGAQQPRIGKVVVPDPFLHQVNMTEVVPKLQTRATHV